MIVYTTSITPRLQYIFGFIAKELGTENLFSVTDNLIAYQQSAEFKLNYSQQRIDENEFFLPPHTLLFEKAISKQDIQCFGSGTQKHFFQATGDFHFDIFAASFYLLSRYEEYLPHEKDMYGRYAHENSLAFKEGFLHLPLVNTWIQDFKRALQQKFPGLLFTKKNQSSLFIPTYDIDQAYSYKHKQLWRNAGGILKQLLKLNMEELKLRWQIFTNKAKDPFDAYQWMDRLHHQYGLKPYYFFIVAEKGSRYDKNISPDKKEMQDLIRHHFYKYPVGIHPSWQSGDEKSLLAQEKAVLEKIVGQQIVSSRQHYIRFTLPETFRRLIDIGIEFDFSMGYGSINGFRASVASSFYWFDLEKNQTTSLLLYPFCYMEANSFFEQKYTAQQAFEEMKHYYNVVKDVEGTMISIWHNSFLGTDKNYEGWREVYEQFIAEVVRA